MRIENAKGRTDGNSGFIRVLGSVGLGQLLSRVQATIISNGTELERMIVSKSDIISNIEDFIDKATVGEQNDGVYLCRKDTIKKAGRYQVHGIKGIEPDLLIFIVERKRLCKVIELKDGDAFDTKKAQGEREHLELFSKTFGSMIPFVTQYYICCFNQENKDVIKTGFKNEFSEEHIMTGSELCEILGIDINEIKESRQQDTKANFDYFIDQILSIPEVREAINLRLEREKKANS